MLFDKREVFVSYSERDLYQMQHALEQASIDSAKGYSTAWRCAHALGRQSGCRD